MVEFNYKVRAAFDLLNDYQGEIESKIKNNSLSKEEYKEFFICYGYLSGLPSRYGELLGVIKSKMDYLNN